MPALFYKYLANKYPLHHHPKEFGNRPSVPKAIYALGKSMALPRLKNLLERD